MSDDEVLLKKKAKTSDEAGQGEFNTRRDDIEPDLQLVSALPEEDV